MEPISLITTIGGVCGAIATIIALITLIVKPLRAKFASWVNKTANTDEFNSKFDDINDKIVKLTGLVEKTIERNEVLQSEMEKQNEALKASLRNSILKLYYCCLNKEYITTFQLQNLEELYSNYRALGGNSFISKCHDYLISKMEVREDKKD